MKSDMQLALEAMEEARFRAEKRDELLKGIYYELRVLNKLLKPIVAEISQMNGDAGKRVEEALIRSDTFIINPDNE